MSFPTSKSALEAAGFRYDCAGRCRGARCKQDFEWWYTPKGKRMPFNADGTPHHATCVDAQQFKKPRTKP